MMILPRKEFFESVLLVSARIIKVVPASQEFVGVIGDNVTIECGATGSPSPLLQISNSTVLPPSMIFYLTFS